MPSLKAEIEKSRKLADEYWEKTIADQIKKGGVGADFAEAARFAKNGARENGLFPDLDDHGNDVYTPEQGAKAACYAREDVAAVLALQRTQLDHLHALSGVKGLLWVCVGLLAYIAYKLS